MRYVAAYLLAVIGGSKSPSAEEIEKILSSVGIEAEKDKLTKVISELNGKNVQQLIDEGKTKLATMPAGGGAAVASAPAAGGGGGGGGGGAAPEAAAKEDKKKVEEKSESEDEDMGFGLFD